MNGDGREAHRRMPQGRRPLKSGVWKMLALMWWSSHSLACSPVSDITTTTSLKPLVSQEHTYTLLPHLLAANQSNQSAWPQSIYQSVASLPQS